MRGNLGSLGFTGESGKRATNGGGGGSIYVRAGGATPTRAPVAASAPVTPRSAPTVAPTVPVGRGTDVVTLRPPVPHLTPDRLYPGRQQGPGKIVVSPTAAVSSTSGSGGGTGSGGDTGESAAAQEKPALPIGLLGLLAYLFFS